MKFSDLNLPEAAADGADLHLRHPGMKHPLYTGPGADANGRLVARNKDHQPVTVRVRSLDSDVVRDAIRKDRKAAMSSGVEDDDSPNLLDAIIADWTGIESDDGKPWPCTRANKIKFMTGNPALNRQITEFSQDQANFFGAASND